MTIATLRRARRRRSSAPSPDAGMVAPGPIRAHRRRHRARPLERRAVPHRRTRRRRPRDDHGLAGRDHPGRRAARRAAPPLRRHGSRSTATGSPCVRPCPTPTAAAASAASTSTCRRPASSCRTSSPSRRSPTARARSPASGTSATTRPTGSRRSPPSSTASAARSPNSTTDCASSPRRCTGGPWRAYADHRMATTGAIVGLAVPGVVVDDIGSTVEDPAAVHRALGADARHDRGGTTTTTTRTRTSSTSPTSACAPTAEAAARAPRRGPSTPTPCRARCSASTAGRYAVLVDEGGADEREITAARASELRRKSVVTGDHVDLVGDTTGEPGHARPHRADRRAIDAAAPQRRRHRRGRAHHRRERRPDAHRGGRGEPRAAHPPRRPLPRRRLRRGHPARCSSSPRPTSPIRPSSSSNFAGLDLPVFRSSTERMPLDEITARPGRAPHRRSSATPAWASRRS